VSAQQFHLAAATLNQTVGDWRGNVSRIERIEPYEKSNFILILKDGNKVPVSRSGMQVLKENLDF